MILKVCKSCNQNFETRYTKKEVCNKPECILYHKRLKYQNSKKEKNCIKCNKIYKGYKKSEYCEDCRYVRNYEKENTIVTLICKRCGIKIEEKELIRDVNSSKIKKHTKICNLCLEKSRINQSENQKGKLNTNFKHNKKIIIKETREEMSNRMKINNPMFDKKVKEKARHTFKEKIKNGEITYKKGKEHHLYKGNRKRSFILRSRLIPWIKKWLKFYDYTCCECDKRGGKLEVHHIKPFREIVSKYTNNLNDLSEDEFERISDLIVEEHKNIEGLVVCKKCHSNIDEYRKI